MKFKRKKITKQRGSKTHGWGAMKKHRGAGHRGGRGNAGSGKRGDAKKPAIWGNQKYFGKHGFHRGGSGKKANPVNVQYFDGHLDKLLNLKLISQEAGVYTVDVAKLGFDKVLGSGKLKNKFKVLTPSCSKAAEEKIKSAGGEVVLTKKKDAKLAEEVKVDKKSAGEAN